MVTIRLSRKGTKKRPYYHIVVADKQYARDGRFIEELGTYDPRLPIETAKLNYERIEYWAGVGAQLSERVSKVIKEHKKAVATS